MLEATDLAELIPNEVRDLRSEIATVAFGNLATLRGLQSRARNDNFPLDLILHKEGAASFHRQLVIGDLASEYRNEIRLWLEELKDQDEPTA